MRALMFTAALLAALVFTTEAAAQRPSLVDGGGQTASRYQDGRIYFYNTGSGKETILPVSPIYFYDDFIGNQYDFYGSGLDTGAVWSTTETSLNAAIGVVADTANGVIGMALSTDSEAERAVLCFGGQECFSVYNGLIFEARVYVAVAPTGNAEIIVGVAGDDNSTADSVDTHAWFKLLGSAATALLWESDDGTTDDDDNAAATVAATTWYVLRIDATDSSHVRFYVDGVSVGEADIDQVDATTGLVQPYIALQKASGSGVGTLYVDYVRVWANR